MVTEMLGDRKIEASERLAQELVRRGSHLLAAYWEFSDESDRWTLMLVPTSPEEERHLIKEATALLVEDPYHLAFSILDAAIESHQIDRAKALGAYIRVQPYPGRRFDKTFTGHQYFESVILVYFRPELLTHLAVVS
jgi:hypothetical protein